MRPVAPVFPDPDPTAPVRPVASIYFLTAYAVGTLRVFPEKISKELPVISAPIQVAVDPVTPPMCKVFCSVL